MLIFREEVQYAIERLVGVVGVQGGQYQVAGLGESNGVFHRFTGTDLADHDHIGRLAQRVAQRHLVRLGIDADLTLGDDAARM